MLRRNVRVLWKYAGYWFLFNCLLVLSTLIAPNQIDTIYYVNSSFYFALGLLAFRIKKSEQFNKDIFFNIAMLFNTMALLELLSFWFPNPNFIFADNVTRQILFAGLASFTIIHFVVKYLLPKRSPITHYLSAGTVALGLNVLNFYPYFTQFTSIEQPLFSLGLLRVNLVVTVFISIYAMKVYRRDSPTGEYLHLIMAGFFFWILRQTVDNFSITFQLMNFYENKYLELANLFFLLVILLKKLNYSISDFGRFYEEMIYGRGKIGDIKIQRRGKKNLKFLIELGFNLFQTPKSLPIILVLIGSQEFFTIPFYLALNITVNLLFIFALFLLTVQLYQKRLNQNYILNQ